MKHYKFLVFILFALLLACQESGPNIGPDPNKVDSPSYEDGENEENSSGNDLSTGESKDNPDVTDDKSESPNSTNDEGAQQPEGANNDNRDPVKIEVTDQELIRQIEQDSMKVTIKNKDGKVFNLYLLLFNKKEHEESGESCYGSKGDTSISGEYKAYYSNDEKFYEIGVSGPIDFNAEREMPLQIIEAEGEDFPNFAAIKQQAGCNGKTYSIFGFDESGEEVVNYKFQENDKIFSELFATSFDYTNDGKLESQTYDNTIAKHKTVIWKIDFKQNLLIADEIQLK